MTNINTLTGPGLSAENALDLTPSSPLPTCTTAKTIDLYKDSVMVTPKNQIQKVFDLSKESSEATYEWMR